MAAARAMPCSISSSTCSSAGSPQSSLRHHSRVMSIFTVHLLATERGQGGTAVRALVIALTIPLVAPLVIAVDAMVVIDVPGGAFLLPLPCVVSRDRFGLLGLVVPGRCEALDDVRGAPALFAQESDLLSDPAIVDAAGHGAGGIVHSVIKGRAVHIVLSQGG